MNNKAIAEKFQALASIMELYNENPFKIRSYQNVYRQLRKQERPLAEMPPDEISQIKGVGKATAEKIQELLLKGEMQTFLKYAEKTPSGIIDMLGIKGFGPKKIRVVWKELGVESIGELLYACNENRLVSLKGFGAKTQADLIEKIKYFQLSENKYHYAKLEKIYLALLPKLQAVLPNTTIELTGAMRRRCPIVESVDILIGTVDIDPIFDQNILEQATKKNNLYTTKTEAGIPIHLYTCNENNFGSKQFMYTSEKPFLQAFLKQTEVKDFTNISDEKTVFEKANMPFIVPELRENETIFEQLDQLPTLLEHADIKGVIHTHTTFSDGIHSLEEMAKYAHSQGYEYIGITDHSKSAFYANGLKEDRLQEQWEIIDRLKTKWNDFKILKGIESDILADGSLDYDSDILRQFDFIIASIHSNLKMDEQKATNRLIKAIENPYTNILGHPTGRLLLSRKGYPIDHQKVIEACAANRVAIELNANPYRLDLDWTWIPYALEKGVKISINPDAHSKEGIHDIRYGVLAARKGGLTQAMCLNTGNSQDFIDFCTK